jgi:menaquinol-cytochrome c reductase iron-sulfur subunit
MQPPSNDSRRSFLKWATNGLGAIFAAIFGVPIVCYLIDPRNRPNPPSALRPVRGVRLSEVTGDMPVQGVLRDVRRDAWTLYPNDVLGRVWICRTKQGNTKDCYVVLSTVCPHLGCAVNANADQHTDPGFTCPCHDGRFERDGCRKAQNPGPPPRNMDALEFDVAADPDNPDPDNRDLLLVKYEKFKQAVPENDKRGA